MVAIAEVKNMFWGVTLDGGKRYTQTVECSFHISMAAIEINTKEPGGINRVSVMIAHEKAEFLVCTLDNKHVYQQPLDLNFSEGEEVTFFLNGQGVVHLTGYLVPEEGPDDEDFDGQLGDEMSDLEEDESEEESDEDEDEDVPRLLALEGTNDKSPGKRKKKTPQRAAKKQKQEIMIDEDSDDDESDEDYEMFAEMDSDLDSEEESGEEDDDEEDESEEEDEDEEEDESEDAENDDSLDMSGSFIQPGKKNKKTPKKTGTPGKTEKKTEKSGTPGKIEKKDQNAQQKSGTPAKMGKKDQNAQQKSGTPAKTGKKDQNAAQKSETPGKTGKKDKSALDKSISKKETPSKKQQGKGNKSDTPNSAAPTKTEDATPNGTTPNSEKKKKKKKKKKNKNKEGESQPVSPADPNIKPSKARKLPGGTTVQDTKEGHGPVATPGKMVNMYYSGRLQNGTQFDSCTSGKPFKFRLGKQEVIKGWDIGIAGMKVGGKRKLTIPPGEAYGNTRTGPIPPNSTLLFEVELKAVS